MTEEFTGFLPFEDEIPYEESAEIVWSLQKGCETIPPGCLFEWTDTGGFSPVWIYVGPAGPPWNGICDPPDGGCYCTCGPNFSGTTIGQQAYAPCCCLVKGTKILLSQGKSKNIEDVVYDDVLKVWDFNNGEFASSHPLWIKKPETTNRYILLEFSDGRTLKTVDQHRIFNKQKKKFTYPMTDDTPLGTITFNVEQQEVRLISKKYVEETVEYFNIISYYHVNLFSDGILTSCRYSNLYPIEEMKYVQENRLLRRPEEFDIPERYFHGLRIAEQTFSKEETEKYVANLQSLIA